MLSSNPSLNSLLPPEALTSTSAINSALQQIRTRRAELVRQRTERDADQIRARCRTFEGFVREAWHVLEPGNPLKWSWHLTAICAHLEAISRGEMIPRLIINVPPGSSKSMLVSVMWQAWEWGPFGNPSARFLTSSFEMENVTRDTRKTRDLIQSEWYHTLWPEVFDDNGKLARSGETSFANRHTGTREGVPFGSILGKRGDCLLGQTIVETDHGPKRIDDLVNSPIACNVMSYDIDSKRVVYRPIEAVARRSSPDFYRVHLASGVIIECTGDHRIYTARGYVEARLLSADDRCLRVVRRNEKSFGERHKESDEARRERMVLQPSVSNDMRQHQGGQGPALSMVRQASTERPSVLRRGMQIESGDSQPGARPIKDSVQAVRNVQPDIQAKEQCDAEAILQPLLQGSGTRYGYLRGEEPRLARGRGYSPLYTLGSETISPGEAQDHREGRRKVCDLHDAKGFVRPSHRHGFDSLRVEEPRDVVPVMSFETARGREVETQEDIVALVERVCESAVVYDIQVASTHCFFANDILVHNCVIIDDPHSLKGAESDLERTGTVRLFLEGGLNRFNDQLKSAMVVVMQRLHMDDLTGALLALDIGFVHLMIPMEFEEDRRCVTPIDWTDPRSYEGQLMDPIRMPPEAIDPLKKVGEYSWNSQYQQRPAPREGGMFKVDKLEIVDSVPAGALTGRGWDLAGSTRKTSAYTVGVRMSRHRGIVYVEDVRRFRASPNEVEVLIANTAKDDGLAILQDLPQDPGAAGKAWKMRLAEILAGFRFSITPETGKKQDRALPFAAQIEAGMVRLVRGPWNAAYIDELRNFPNGTYKDQVDASSRAFAALLRGDQLQPLGGSKMLDPYDTAVL